MSGLENISCWSLCCISMKLADPIPRLAAPGRPPRLPRPNGVWLVSGKKNERLIFARAYKKICA